MLARESNLARLLLGTYIPDALPSSELEAWVQDQCRTGLFAPTVEKFSREQDEVLDPKLARVVEISPNGFKLSFPCKMYERESISVPLETEVLAWLRPRAGVIQRVLL